MKNRRIYFLSLILISIVSFSNAFLFHFFAPQYVKVFMKDGSSIIGRYYAFTSDRNEKEETILKLNRSGRSIKPFETDSIQIDFLVGIPFNDNTCWIFKVIDGDVCAYSIKPDRETDRITHIQKSGGPVVSYKRDVLREYISDNESALGLFSKIWDRTEKREQVEGAREAILEYNFNLVSNEKRLVDLTKKMNKAKSITEKAKHARGIIDIDSTNYEAFEILGDYEITVNKDKDKAYFYYTNTIRYSPRKYPDRYITDKITDMNKKVIY